jgi:hypothetical protein
MLKVLSLGILVGMFLSCGNHGNFNQQKYTHLHKIKFQSEEIADQNEEEDYFDEDEVTENSYDNSSYQNEEFLIDISNVHLENKILEPYVNDGVVELEDNSPVNEQQTEISEAMILSDIKLIPEKFSKKSRQSLYGGGGGSGLMTLIAGLLIILGGLLLMMLATELFWGLVALLLIVVGAVGMLVGIVMLLVGY